MATNRRQSEMTKPRSKTAVIIPDLECFFAGFIPIWMAILETCLQTKACGVMSHHWEILSPLFTHQPYCILLHWSIASWEKRALSHNTAPRRRKRQMGRKILNLSPEFRSSSSPWNWQSILYIKCFKRYNLHSSTINLHLDNMLLLLCKCVTVCVNDAMWNERLTLIIVLNSNLFIYCEQAQIQLNIASAWLSSCILLCCSDVYYVKLIYKSAS